jgi:hypothetical protein
MILNLLNTKLRERSYLPCFISREQQQRDLYILKEDLKHHKQTIDEYRQLIELVLRD